MSSSKRILNVYQVKLNIKEKRLEKRIVNKNIILLEEKLNNKLNSTDKNTISYNASSIPIKNPNKVSIKYFGDVNDKLGVATHKYTLDCSSASDNDFIKKNLSLRNLQKEKIESLVKSPEHKIVSQDTQNCKYKMPCNNNNNYNAFLTNNSTRLETNLYNTEEKANLKVKMYLEKPIYLPLIHNLTPINILSKININIEKDFKNIKFQNKYIKSSIEKEKKEKNSFDPISNYYNNVPVNYRNIFTKKEKKSTSEIVNPDRYDKKNSSIEAYFDENSHNKEDNIKIGFQGKKQHKHNLIYISATDRIRKSAPRSRRGKSRLDECVKVESKFKELSFKYQY